MTDLEKYKTAIDESGKKDGVIRARHTRHFAKIKEKLSEEDWKELVTYANEEHGIDLNKAAEMGKYRERK